VLFAFAAIGADEHGALVQTPDRWVPIVPTVGHRCSLVNDFSDPDVCLPAPVRGTLPQR